MPGVKEKPTLEGALIALYFFLSFFESYYGPIFGSVTKYYILLIVVVIVANNGFKIIRQPMLYPLLLWFVYKCVSLLWAMDTYIFQLHIVTHIGMVMLLYFIAMKPSCKKDIELVTLATWLGSFVIGLLAIFNSVAYKGVSSRMVLELWGQISDPNNQAVFTAIGIAIALYYLFVEQKYKLFCILTLLINPISTFMTGSRGGVVTVAAILFVFIFIYMNNGRNKVLAIVLLFTIIISLSFLLPHVLPGDVYSRIFESSYEGGSDRINIWGNAWELINDPISLLFGAGWGSYWGFNGYYCVVHNTYLSMLCDVGIIGVLLFFFPIIKSSHYLYVQKQYLPILIITASLVPCFFLEAINKRFFWNAIIFLFMYYQYYNSKIFYFGKGARIIDTK